MLLGTAAGGAAALLDRVSVWRFLSPPPALLRGVLVDAAGKRICDESRYGAAIGDQIIGRGGRAWLFADRATIAAARRQLRGSTLWFQRLQAWYLLTLGRVSADTVGKVAAKAGVDPDGLAATVAAHNADATDTGAGSADPTGKPADQVRAQDRPPYSLIDYSIRPRLLNPAPVLTLGGLVVDHGTGQVLRQDGTAVPGLYAAGRSAVGLCSRSYVSGLSIADCVFSGRLAGRHAAAASPWRWRS
jgi:3-oxo-5alpha-steroid 4-dehydrogenase